jgi:hypothetical protein
MDKQEETWADFQLNGLLFAVLGWHYQENSLT